MKDPAPQSPGRRRLFRIALLATALLLIGWIGFSWGRSVWWGFLECPDICAPDQEASLLALRTGAALPILRRQARGDRLWVEYLTQEDTRDRSRLCEEVRGAVEVLQTQGDLVEAKELVIEPTDPHTRLLAITWAGPVFSCCASTAIFARQTADGKWQLSSGGCSE